MLPYINQLQSAGFAVLILNPNENMDLETRRPIAFNETMEDHLSYVWERFVAPYGG
jgi:hypothetical protein